MPQFDPRRQPVRFAPALGAFTLALSAAGMMSAAHSEPNKRAHDRPMLATASLVPPTPVALAPAAPPPPVWEAPDVVPVKLRAGESLEAAVVRAGVAPTEAEKAVALIRASFDPSKIEAGLRFETSVSDLRGQDGQGRLMGLSLRPAPERRITVARLPDNTFHVDDKVEEIIDETGVVEGELKGSLYTSAKRAGVQGGMIKDIVKVFASKLDFQRDIRSGDRFRLVYDRTITESGEVIKTGDLLYAEVEAKGNTTRFYRFKRKDGRVEWLDDTGSNTKSGLLRSPVDGARMSSGFGMRRHPILGYNRMHQGVDFAAGTGTPVMAAGDGVVIEMRRWGGYGNWLRIKHSGGYESGYAHLSKYASGLDVGDTVRQGEVVAYVGSTGRSTGPHLHHEIWLKGARVDPKGAKVPQGTVLIGSELAAFKVQKRKVEHALEGSDRQYAKKDKLRPSQA